MYNILEELWNGNLVPIRTCGCGNPEIEEFAQLMQRNKDDLCKELTAVQKDIFEKYCDCSEEYTYFLSTQAFHDGFCLAAKLLTEALSFAP